MSTGFLFANEIRAIRERLARQARRGRYYEIKRKVLASLSGKGDRERARRQRQRGY